MSDSRAGEVQTYLQQNGHAPQNFSQPTPTSAAAAKAIGCSVGEIAKSILLLVGRQPVLVVTSGDTRVKSGRIKQVCALSGQVKLPAPDEVLRWTGYAPGAVSPFLLPENLPVLLDRSLQRFAVVYPAAGTGCSAVAITFEGLRTLCKGRVVDVCDTQESTERKKEV